MRVKTAGSAFKYSYFVTLTYDNAHIPLMKCEVLHSEYEDALSISRDKVFGYERHSYIPVSDYQPEDSSFFRQMCIRDSLVWMLFVVLSRKRNPLTTRYIPLLNNMVLVTLYPS